MTNLPTSPATIEDPTQAYISDRAAAGAVNDELIDRDGGLHSHWAPLAEAYRRLGSAELRRRQDEIRIQVEREGVSYNIPGPSASPPARRNWALDPLPLVIPEDEWQALERGVAQRAELLDAVLSDLHGPRRLLRDRIVPPAMVLSDAQYLRAADGVTLPGPRQLVLAATDLFRAADGSWRSLGHRTQAPSGMAYALDNRRVVARVFPRLFRSSEVRRIGPFIRAYRTAIQAASPPGRDSPTVVVLSAGSQSETAYEHGAIATRLGYPLVEGSDLRIRKGRVWLKTISEQLPVDVILRRLDALSCDPLELRPESTLGVPGLVDACRTGAVSVINPLGAGVLENAALTSILPRLARSVLGEDLAFATAEAWWCGEATARSHVLANLGRLVVRPRSRASLVHSIDTTRLAGAELDQLRRRIEAEPTEWVGQERIEPATSPVLIGGRLRPRATMLRSFAVADGDSYRVMPGGLARTAGDDPDQPVANRLGARSKDAWVLGTDVDSLADGERIRIAGAATTIASTPARAAENLFWLGRYAERAEATVRLLRAVAQRRADLQPGSTGPDREAVRHLLVAATRITGTWPGFVGDDAEARLAEPGDELRSLVIDPDRPGTVAHAVDRMLAAIEAVRDQLSVDTWLVVGSIQRRIERLDPDDPERDEAEAALLDDLLHGLLSLSGLATESMVRDQGWHFMDAGRRIERALHVAALVGETVGSANDFPTEGLLLESVAAATESIVTYRRRYRWQARTSALLELLITDPGNPRSLRFQIDRLDDDLAHLRASRPTADAPSATPLVLELSRRLQDADPDRLAAPDPDQRRPGLIDLTATARDLLRRASDGVEADYFTRQLPQQAVLAPVEVPRSRA
ncbi:MAG: circularly permuted type 2 ATP-grasp protein [Actinomycetota bacterium]